MRTADAAMEKGPLFYVEVKGAELDGRQFLVSSDGLLVGRSPTCDVIFENREVSRRHCYFYPDGKSCHVQDLGSKNGILINGKPAKASRLTDGAVVGLGSSRLVLHVEGLPAEDADQAGSTARTRIGDRDVADFAAPRHPLAVAAMVFALLACLHWAFGLGALVLSLVMLVETRAEKDRPSAGLAVGALILGVVGAGMNMWFTEAAPRLRAKEETEAQQECHDNLVSIAAALTAYRKAHDGTWPVRLEDLVANSLLETRQLLCPGLRLDGGGMYGYLYYRPDAATPEALRGVVACDPSLACHQDQGGWVLRADGNPEWMPHARFSQLLSQLKGARRLPLPGEASPPSETRRWVPPAQGGPAKGQP